MLFAPFSLAPELQGGVAFILGAMIGSFLNVVVYRFPKGQSIVWPGSSCPGCAAPIRYWQNIPLLSFVLLRGRCGACRTRISWRYPLTEGVTGLLFFFAFQRFGLSFETVMVWIFFALLVAIFWIDWDTFSIYDQFTLPGVLLGLIYSYFFRDQLFSALAALCATVALLLLLNSLTLWILGVDGLGDGDLTLVAMLGAWLGLNGALVAMVVALFVASALGLGLLYHRWAREGCWVPHSAALGVACCIFLGFCSLSAWPVWPQGFWYGSHLSEAAWGAALSAATLLGAGFGWALVKMTRDEGRLVMPFGPALSFAGVVSLFQGSSLHSHFETLILGITVG
ncbi:MAG: prepilin peptidase [Candidatus Sericytochromatia bacterium]|nr:prepilin peptidase [Candidatus Sericytochromatia bacterium]